MNAYIFLTWLVICNLFLVKLKNKKLLLLCVIVPMFLSLATQVNIGTDYFAYVHSFLYPDINEYEIGYYLLNVILRRLTSNPRILFIVVSLIQTVLLYKIIKILYIKKIIENIPLFIFCICTNTLYVLMFNGIRSSIAVLFFTYALLLYYLLNSKKKAILMIIIGALFHKSIIVAIIIIIFLKKILNRTYKKIVLVLFAIIATILNAMGLIPKLALFLFNNLPENFPYKYYLISEHMQSYNRGFGIATYIFIIIYIFSIYFYKKSKDTIFLYNIGILCIILTLFFNDIPIFKRFIDYFCIMESLLRYRLLKGTLKKSYMYISVFLFILYLLSTVITIMRMVEYNNTYIIKNIEKILPINDSKKDFKEILYEEAK
ncbi:EpsG family protein [Fusobacterium pseudoperiodonticum]|uniref:EpsG family protein n=1 Tax=Fusobacterium pseudoperiodonticum TaxID=2663009 RepID=UPI000C1C4A64|nr:EpsG family protein [Fusobacterium pseudoperiodonticum]ATV57515.1 hypothetical protein CTM68_07410 [Fusobacterium pseudoperiodonticum]